MKFLVAVDMEGIACAVAPPNGGVEDSFNIVETRKQATREADSAVKALFDNGASEVVVWDNHGRGCSLNYYDLDERCKIAIGSTVETRFPILDETFSGVVLIGYHACASTFDSAIAHTYSMVNYQYIKLNNKEYGEIGIDAVIAGELNVPVIFISSDDKGVLEAKDLMPNIEAVETKKSLAYTRIVSKHPKAVVKEIYEGVSRAVKRLDEMTPLKIKTPIEIEIRYRRPDQSKHARLVDMNGDYFEFLDVYTRKGTVGKAADIIFRI